MAKVFSRLLGRLHAFFDWLSHRAGMFFFVSVLGASLYGGAYYVAFDQGSKAAGRGTPIPLNLLIFAGLIMIVYSFITGGRNRAGKWPTMPVLAFSYLFGITIVVVVISRVDRVPYLPDLPDVLLYSSRAALYWMIFSVGWVLGYGGSKGWNRRTVDPRPFRWLFRNATAVKPGQDDENGM